MASSMSLAEIDAALRQGMDDEFDGPTRPCGAPARPAAAAPPPPEMMDSAALDAALLEAMDGMDGSERTRAPNIASATYPSAAEPHGRSMGYLSLPESAVDALMMPPPPPPSMWEHEANRAADGVASDRRAGVIRMHVLKLHENPVLPGNDWERFRCRWLLDDPAGEVAPGDVICLEELMTGAGEFEGLRFACALADPAEASARPHLLELQQGGDEAPSFPPGIVRLVEEEGGAGLRSRYHAVLDRLLVRQGLSMAVFCEGCDGGVEGFWSDVEAGGCRGQVRQPRGEWLIPLAACERVSTEVFVISE